MTVQDWTTIGSFGLGIISSFVTFLLWHENQAKSAARRERDAERDYQHLTRNYEQLSTNLKHLADELDGFEDYLKEFKLEMLNYLMEMKNMDYKRNKDRNREDD